MRKLISYFYWTGIRWNKKLGDSESLAKWKAEAGINLIFAWYITPLIFLAMDRIGTNKFWQFGLPVAIFNAILIHFYFLKNHIEYFEDFENISASIVKKRDIGFFIFIVGSIGLSGFLIKYLK